MFDRVEWEDLYSRLARTWRQSQHGLAMAPTGRGKTVLIQKLVSLRHSVAFFGTKTYDEEYVNLIKTQGYSRVMNWPPAPYLNKVMLWPIAGKTMAETRTIQRRVFARALDQIFRQGRWTVVFDELHWMANNLRLYDDIAHMHHQGRSSKLTLIDGFQRPAFVPVIVYSSATHVFAWGTNHIEDLRKLRSVAKLDSLSMQQLAGVMGTLGEHEFVYVNTRDNRPPVISQVRR